jgi:hypothetical protein
VYSIHSSTAKGTKLTGALSKNSDMSTKNIQVNRSAVNTHFYLG